MGWWRDCTRLWWEWSGSWEKTKKPDWPGHLAEIVHAYNATQLCHVTGYSLHYMMFRWRPRLPVDFYFSTFRITEAPMWEASAKYVDKYMATVWDQLKTTLQEASGSIDSRSLLIKNHTMTRKIGAMNLKPGNLVLVKADAFKGKRKIRDQWEEETYKVVHQIAKDIPSYEMTDQCRQSCILHWNFLLLIA